MYEQYGIKKEIIKKIEECEKRLSQSFLELESIYEKNQLKVLKSLIDNKLSEAHFQESTGYGYNDQGRDIIDNIYKDIFHSEDAFVRPTFASGTHTLSTALFALTKKGDKIISINGYPYDTLHKILGIHGEQGSLKDNGVDFDKVDLIAGTFDREKIKTMLLNEKNIKLVMIQRSKGYEMRHSFSVFEIKEIIDYIRSIRQDIIIFVDNCYGEFTDTDEPTDVGADVVVGSLIKNIGGGIARSGGYVCGRKIYVDKVADRLYCPNMGREVGINYNENRNILMGLFNAPKVVKECLMGLKLWSIVFENEGFNVLPRYDEKLNDIVTCIELKTKENMIKFAKALQTVSTVDSFIEPVPSNMPGYEKQIIMACGSFINGSSIELSCDGTFAEPYNIYVQGGLSYYQIKLAVMKCIQAIEEY